MSALFGDGGHRRTNCDADAGSSGLTPCRQRITDERTRSAQPGSHASAALHRNDVLVSLIVKIQRLRAFNSPRAAMPRPRTRVSWAGSLCQTRWMTLTAEQLRLLRLARRKEWGDVMIAHVLALVLTSLGVVCICATAGTQSSPLFLPLVLYWSLSRILGAVPLLAVFVLLLMVLLPIGVYRLSGYRNGGTCHMLATGLRLERGKRAALRNAAVPTWLLDRLNRSGRLPVELGVPVRVPRSRFSLFVVAASISMHHLAFSHALDTLSCQVIPWYLELPSWQSSTCKIGVVTRSPDIPPKFAPAPWCAH